MESKYHLAWGKEKLGQGKEETPSPTPTPHRGQRLQLALHRGAGVTEARNPWRLEKILTEAGG